MLKLDKAVSLAYQPKTLSRLREKTFGSPG